MKKSKLLAGALALLTFSTAATVTGTVAWFSANTTVTAQGMKIKAKAEQGIVISNAAAGTYAEVADSTVTDELELLPASTSAFTTWYHANSKNPSEAFQSDTVYTAVTNDSDNVYYAEHSFYVRASAAEDMKANLTFDNVTVTLPETSVSTNLNKAIRVGIKVSDMEAAVETAIYAPLNTEVGAYKVWNGTNKTDTTVTPVETYTTDGDISIPNNKASGTLVSVFIWFEGEDANCISDNITATLDSLTVSFDITCSNLEAVGA